jgi:hypothetical protein
MTPFSPGERGQREKKYHLIQGEVSPVYCFRPIKTPGVGRRVSMIIDTECCDFIQNNKFQHALIAIAKGKKKN